MVTINHENFNPFKLAQRKEKIRRSNNIFNFRNNKDKLIPKTWFAHQF